MTPKIKNVLFDFDGTLFNTQKLHSQVESQLLAEHGIILTPIEITEKYSGVRTEEFFTELLGDKSLAISLVEKKWETLFRDCHEVEAMTDLHQLFSFLQSQDILFGIGTASPRRWVEMVLQRKSLIHFFDEGSIVGGDMVEKGKPEPETWLRLRRDISCGECFVIEDGVSGAVAAITAGMHCAVLGQPESRFPKGVLFINSLDVIPEIIAQR